MCREKCDIPWRVLFFFWLMTLAHTTIDLEPKQEIAKVLLMIVADFLLVYQTTCIDVAVVVAAAVVAAVAV